MSDEVLKAALDYAAAGFPIIPVRRKRDGGKWRKVPVFKGWQELASTDTEQVTVWFDVKYPQPDVGVAVLTGTRSGLFLLDIDSPEGHSGVDGFKSLRDLKKRTGLKLDHVPGWITPTHGNSFMFRLEPGQVLKSSTSVLGPGIDTKGTGSFAVLPPSRLDLTRPPYQWLNGYRLQDAPPLPPEILELLQKKRTAEHNALETACDSIRTAPAGTAHDRIVSATWQVAAHVLSGKLSLGEALNALNAAAVDRGHDRLEVESALEGAMARQRTSGKGGRDAAASAGHAAVHMPDVEPWPDPVIGAAVLREICLVIRRYVVLGTVRLVGVAFWVFTTHFLPIATHCPRLAVFSPRQRCGKTTLLRVVGELVPRPLNGENLSPAVLYHLAEKLQPTFLLDEVDNQLASSNPDNKVLRGLINSGHEVNGKAWRMSGEGAAMVPVSFRTFSPMALAGIGALTGPTGDRCIHIALARRLPGEAVERFDYENLEHLRECRAKLARWALDNLDQVKAARPAMPQALNDREIDNWRLAFRVAEVIGRGWPAMLAKAARILSARSADDEDDIAVQLLIDCRVVWESELFTVEGWIKSVDLLAELRLMEERPWATYGRNDAAMNSAQLARLLRPFGIRSANHDFNPGSREGRKVVKGYEWKRFEEAWKRYAPPANSQK